MPVRVVMNLLNAANDEAASRRAELRQSVAKMKKAQVVITIPGWVE